jgi:hypothetical protein
MFDIYKAIDEFVYSKFTNKANEIYILKGFYDININDSVYYRINMMAIKKQTLIIYRLNSRMFSLGIDKIYHISVFNDYRKLNFRINARQ